MKGFSYVDLFATKGIEYLLVIGFLLVLVLYWRLLNQPIKAPFALGVAERRAAPVNGWFRLAEGMYYHQGHSWAMPEDDDVVKIGIDDFAQRLLGKPHSINLPRIGARIEQGEKGWKLQVDSKSIDMLSPVNGEVLAINEEILVSPDLINQDPYGKGWLAKVKVSKMKTDLKNLLSGKLAKAWMQETENTFRERMAGHLGLALQDGGLPVAGIARILSPESWDEIAMEFLLSR
jgi:glycine cleavage system H lipoate-binding protein